jgi:hypothetical protein
MASRREVLKLLGMVVAAPTVAVAKKAPEVCIGIPARAFVFQCKCGAEIVAKLPEDVGSRVEVECEGCSTISKLFWKGTHWSFRENGPEMRVKDKSKLAKRNLVVEYPSRVSTVTVPLTRNEKT